ncbi:MAG: hypothetical protein JWQ18_994, partial [Conexibacter sp.]|nr:hypothetical protein [Conexibacter sp.]
RGDDASVTGESGEDRFAALVG